MEIKDNRTTEVVTSETSNDLIEPIRKVNPKKKLLLKIKFSNSEINIPAYLVPLGLLAIILMIIIESLLIIIAIPIVLTFMGGVIMENISLEYEEHNLIVSDTTYISINEEE